MAIIKVVGLFDDPAALEQAKAALIDAGLADEDSLRIEREGDLPEERPEQRKRLWERLKEWFEDRPDENPDAYAEGVRRGGLLLVVTIPEERAEQVKDVMRQHGAVDLRRRVLRWMDLGWKSFDWAGVAYTEEEVVEERRACVDKRGAESSARADDDAQSRNVRLFDEATGKEIGRISEAELRVLQDALEAEDPDDNDYWINPDEIDDLACRPGATPHLISLLRAAAGDNPDGIDIAFQREGEPRQSLRNRNAGTAPGGR